MGWEEDTSELLWKFRTASECSHAVGDSSELVGAVQLFVGGMRAIGTFLYGMLVLVGVRLPIALLFAERNLFEFSIVKTSKGTVVKGLAGHDGGGKVV